MAIDADLWTIELKTSETTETVESDVVKIESFDNDQKKKLDAEFAKSEVWKSFKSKLEAIKSDVNKTTEWKKRDMVAFLKDYFEVWNDKDEQIKRFVVNGKSYMRINDWNNSFDIELSDTLMPTTVDWFLTTTEAQINEWITNEEDKIKLKYEKEKEFIKKTQAELKDLKDGVSPVVESGDFWSRTKFKANPSEWIKWVWPWMQNTMWSVKDFFTNLPSLWDAWKETVATVKSFSLWWLFGKK